LGSQKTRRTIVVRKKVKLKKKKTAPSNHRQDTYRPWPRRPFGIGTSEVEHVLARNEQAGTISSGGHSAGI
jgi:hypothetical protein